MKIDADVTAERGAGGPMETAIRLAKAASDADLETLAALGRCLSAAAKAERDRRRPAKKTDISAQEAKSRRARKFHERFSEAAVRARVTPTKEML